MIRILGISAFYHDSAAALVHDGDIIAAAQEERFSRKKHDSSFPLEAVRYCLAADGAGIDDIDYVVFYDKPFLKFERLLETYVAYAPRGFESFQIAAPLWIREKLFQRRMLWKHLRKLGPNDRNWQGRLLFSEHHLSHAASAFFPSPYDNAAILTIDGVGEWATTSAAVGTGNSIELLKEIRFPHSLGLLYSAFTYYCGFKVNSGEYKLMGLAPYGRPSYAQRILEELIDIKSDGSFRLNMDYFDYCVGTRMTNRRFDELFGGPARLPEREGLHQRHLDIAASIQSVVNEVMLRLTRSLAAETGLPNLCLAGGVALNCVANSEVLRDGRFRSIWIQPAAGDAGGALGAALAAFHLHLGQARAAPAPDGMNGALLGPSFSQQEIEARLRSAGANFRVLDDSCLIETCVDALVSEKAVGLFQGRMEFGPRALGNRSIVADPRSPRMQSILNNKVKRRESFRPFAPSVLKEDVGDWFDLDVDSPYMLLVADVAEHRRKPLVEHEHAVSGLTMKDIVRSEIPAVTHVDCSARVQTVDRQINPRYHALLSAFKSRTGCPVLVNTSFNVRGEPIVCTPEDALKCFWSTDIDLLIAGSCVLDKRDQPTHINAQIQEFALD